MGSCLRYGSLCLLAMALSVSFALADQPAVKKDEPAKPAAPATQTVKKGLLKITLELDGVFEATAAQELAVRTDEWTALSVLRVAPHGAVVRKGDTILELDPEKLDRAIADAVADLEITRLTLRQNEEQLKLLEKTTTLDLEAGERAAKQAEEDRAYYVDVDRSFMLKSAEFNLKAAKESLEYNQEELRQLEKMYKADDITEETEAIVLKRARDTVEHCQFALETAQLTYNHTIKFAIPRKDYEVKESTTRKLQEWEKNKVVIPMELQRQRLETAKLQVQRSRAEERLKRLQDDRKELTVKSPADGIVYYGRITRGKTADSAAMADALRVGGVIQPNQIVMTLVEPRPMCIRAAAPEGGDAPEERTESFARPARLRGLAPDGRSAS